jgi:hypothetical protein
MGMTIKGKRPRGRPRWRGVAVIGTIKRVKMMKGGEG